MGKSAARPRPGKTLTNKFSRVGPTLVEWMDSQDGQASIEVAFQQELKQREQEGKKGLPDPHKPIPRLQERPKAVSAPGDDETDGSCVDESDTACSDFEDTCDEDEKCSETSFADREADYGSSEDEYYQIDSRRLPQVRPLSFRPRQSAVVVPAPGIMLEEEEFVPE